MWWVIGILIYLIIGFFTYKFVVSKWNMPKWEKIWTSLSWICIIPLYGVRKIQEWVTGMNKD